MNISEHFAATILNKTLSIYNNASLKIYSGTPGTLPTSVETAPTGSVLVAWTFAETAFPLLSFPPIISGGSVAATSNNFIVPTQNPTTGTAGYARAFVWQWIPGAAIAPNSYAFNAGNLYYTSSGGTTGTTAPTVSTGSISDGTVTWTFVQTANNSTSGHAISDHSVNTAAADIIVGSTAFTTGISLTLTNLTITKALNA